MFTPPYHTVLERIAPVAARIPATRLHPEAFFVARYGVLTLAYKGFPAPILELKREVDRLFPDLPPENPGSLWPKTTLAALSGDEPLTPDDIVLLREATQAGTICLSRGRRGLAVDAVELVELGCRSMEKSGRRKALPLGGGVDDGKISPEHRTEVNTVLTQWRREGLSQYVPHLTRAGHREGHYRRPLRELSLVIGVGAEAPCLDHFRRAVEDRMPGRYVWFSPESLHVTVRSLGAHDDG